MCCLDYPDPDLSHWYLKIFIINSTTSYHGRLLMVACFRINILSLLTRNQFPICIYPTTPRPRTTVISAGEGQDANVDPFA